MDFNKALNADAKSERDELIESEICDGDWYEYVQDHLRHGGRPDDVSVDNTEIDDSAEDSITVKVDISFLELVQSSCQDITHDHKGWAKYRVTISKIDSSYDVESIDASVAAYGDDWGEHVSGAFACICAVGATATCSLLAALSYPGWEDGSNSVFPPLVGGAGVGLLVTVFLSVTQTGKVFFRHFFDSTPERYLTHIGVRTARPQLLLSIALRLLCLTVGGLLLVFAGTVTVGMFTHGFGLRGGLPLLIQLLAMLLLPITGCIFCCRFAITEIVRPRSRSEIEATGDPVRIARAWRKQLGWSPGKIAAELNRRDYRLHDNTDWDEQAVRHVLKERCRRGSG